jgi:hypothetical protein
MRRQVNIFDSVILGLLPIRTASATRIVGQ